MSMSLRFRLQQRKVQVLEETCESWKADHAEAMEPHVIVEKVVSRALGEMGLPRELLVRVPIALHEELRRRYGELRSVRDPEDPDCFRYRLPLASGDHWHVFFFRVNDTRAQGNLFAETVDRESNPSEPG
jgi:hypothetical protein